MSATTARPLTGKRIVVTRSPESAEAMAQKLAALGAIPICLPVIDFAPLPAPELDQALTNLSQYHWLIFTSPNAVRFFLNRLETNHQLPIANQPINQSPITNHQSPINQSTQSTQSPINPITQLPNYPITQFRLAAIGQTTARLLFEKGLKVDFIPDEFTGQQLALGLGDVAGQRILLPRARIGRPEITALLRERGALVDDIALYDTITAVPDPAALAEIEKGVDVITFTSPSSVRNFLEVGQFAKLSHSLIACIGPSTAAEAEKQGLTADIVAGDYTIDGLITAVAAYYEHN